MVIPEELPGCCYMSKSILDCSSFSACVVGLRFFLCFRRPSTAVAVTWMLSAVTRPRESLRDDLLGGI